MIPRKFEPFLVGAVLSGLMSWVVSGVATLKAAGQSRGPRSRFASGIGLASGPTGLLHPTHRNDPAPWVRASRPGS